jgi:peroxiredoxin-like protein
MESTYIYTVNAHWTGARTGSVKPEQMKLPVFFNAPPEFGGEAGHWTPEHMLMAAVASCYVATFSAIAQNSKYEFLDLEVAVEGLLVKEEKGWRFVEIIIRPKLAISDAAREERGIRLLQKAERGCLIARSLSAKISLEALVHVPHQELIEESDLVFAE